MKKTLRLLAVTFFAIFLTACNIQTVEQFEKMEEQEQSVDHSPTDEKVEQMELGATTDTTEKDAKQETPRRNSNQKKEPKETVTEETKQQQATETETKTKRKNRSKPSLHNQINNKQQQDKQTINQNHK